MEMYTHVSIVKLTQVYSMTHPTLQGEPQAPETGEVDELLETLDEEAVEEN